MELVAHDKKAAKRLNIPQSIGHEFVMADKGKDVSNLPSKVKKGGKINKIVGW